MSKTWKQYLRKDPICPHCQHAISSLKGVERVSNSNQVIKCPQCGTELSIALRFPKASFALAAVAGLASTVVMLAPENLQVVTQLLQVLGGACAVAFIFSMMQLKFVGQ